MRILQASCEVSYKGRGDTELALGTRLIIIKNDDSVLIHQDKGTRPLNYMGGVKLLKEFTDENGNYIIHAESKKETLDITIHHLGYDMQLDFDDDSELIRTGTEKQLQSWLENEDNFAQVFDSNIKFLCREYQTTKGAVDLLGQNTITNQLVLIEVKRKAKRSDVYQLIRYRDAIRNIHDSAVSNNQDIIRTTQVKDCFCVETAWTEQPEMYLVASELMKGVADEAAENNIIPVKLGYNWLDDCPAC